MLINQKYTFLLLEENMVTIPEPHLIHLIVLGYNGIIF